MQPRDRLIGGPARGRFADDGDRRRSAVPAVMAMNVDGTGRRLRRLDQFGHAIRGHAIVADREMDVAQAVFTRGLRIGLAAIHADDRFHPELRNLGERGIAVRRITREDIRRGPEEIMNMRRGQPRGDGVRGGWSGFRSGQHSAKTKQRSEKNPR